MAELFYIIGASGSGKDSLIRYARTYLPESAPIVFSHRYITRHADAGGENHIALSEEEFISRAEQQFFSMAWFSHNTHYGIGNEINQWLEKGLSVVVNGSRAYLEKARQDYPQLHPILISVSPEVLRKRLVQRGRETLEQIEKRLIRAQKLEQELADSQLIKIDNNGPLNVAGEQFVAMLTRNMKTQCA